MFNLLENLFNFADLHVCFIILLNLMVIFFKNPINSLLCFIFSVINVVAIFIFFEADFVALVFFLVYVGAIAVLFLALIMFLNLSYLFYTEDFNEKNTKYNNVIYILIFCLIFISSLNEIFNIQVIIPTMTNISLHNFGINYLSYLMYEKNSFIIVYSGFLLFFTTVLTLAYTTLPRYKNIDIIKNLMYREETYLKFLEIDKNIVAGYLYNFQKLLLNKKKL
jgi:NADH:ubiquinone oxidoreductase subunit 6 (subunit J)